MTQNITIRAATFAFYSAFFDDLLFGLPENIHGDRIKYELQSLMNTAWQQLYGNVNSTLSEKKQVIPATDPAMFSAAQQVLYMQEQVETVVDKLGKDSDLDGNDEYQLAMFNLENAEHRLTMRDGMFNALNDLWNKYIGEPYEYRAYEQKRSTTPVGNPSEMREQLQKRRSALQNFHLTDSEKADAEGETA
jgi:hypothetical protein